MSTYPKGPFIHYEDLQRDATTFDLLLWCGGSEISSIIRTFTRTDWYSHVGMVVRLKNDPEVYTYESDWDSKTVDLLTNTRKNGPRLVNVREKMKNYDGPFFAYRRLHLPAIIEHRPGLSQALEDFMYRTTDAHYEYNLFELFRNIYRGNVQNTHAYFCTELVAQVLIELGILVPLSATNNYKVNDYEEKQQASSILRFTDPSIYLGHEQYISLASYKKKHQHQ